MAAKKPVLLQNRTDIPVHIGLVRNDVMKCWEVLVMMGNIKTKEEAEDVADAMREILTKEFDATDVETEKSH